MDLDGFEEHLRARDRADLPRTELVADNSTCRVTYKSVKERLEMPSKRVRLTFPPDLVTEPVIYNVGRKFGVVTNIRRANIENNAGWVVLEISGDDDDLNRAVAYMRETGVEVEPVEGDVLAS